MCQNYAALLSSLDIVKAEYFEDEVLVWFFRMIEKHYAVYKTRPDEIVFKNELIKSIKTKYIKQEDLPKYTEVLTQLWTNIDSKDYVVTELKTFCTQQALKKAILESATMIDSNTPDVWDQIQDKIKKACATGANIGNLGVQYFMNYAERMNDRLKGTNVKIVPTGIRELDNAIGGGLQAGQLGVGIGSSGNGKSLFLSHNAKRAVVAGLKVVYYSFELSEPITAARFDASWCGLTMAELMTAEGVIGAEKTLDDLAKTYENNLIIKYFPANTATVNTLRAHIEQLRGIGFVPDVVIVDYADYVKPTTRYQKRYEDLGSIYIDLIGLVGEIGAVGWTASQVNREGMGPENDLLEMNMIAGSVEKVNTCDVMVAICRNKEEAETEHARLNIIKNRNGPCPVVIRIRTDYKHMSFYKVGGETASTGLTSTPSKEQSVAELEESIIKQDMN